MRRATVYEGLAHGFALGLDPIGALYETYSENPEISTVGGRALRGFTEDEKVEKDTNYRLSKGIGLLAGLCIQSSTHFVPQLVCLGIDYMDNRDRIQNNTE